MLSFAYTIDVQLRDTLARIDQLRTQILALPLSPKDERRLQWEGTAIRTWATLALSGYNTPKQYVATILSHPGKLKRNVMIIQSIRTAYDYIHETWRANPKPVSLLAMETLFTTLYPGERTRFAAYESKVKELLHYLETEPEHPLIQSGIAHIHILTIPGLDDPGLLARAVGYLILAKYGFDLRGYATPDRVWQSDVAYTHISGTYTKERQLNTWLEFMAQTIQRSYETLLTDIQNERFHIEFPPNFWLLADRQKEILKSLEHPEDRVTNRHVQKKYHISQITASRDLARLTSLGLLYPHGKGRAVYYTKI